MTTETLIMALETFYEAGGYWTTNYTLYEDNERG
jgi:hypothetical protein